MKSAASTRATRRTFRLRNGRILFLAGVVFFVAFALFVRLFYLQIQHFSEYREIAERQQTISQFLQARRGEIFLKDEDAENGVYPVAINREYTLAYVAPNRVRDFDGVLSFLISVFGMDRAEAEKKLSDKSDPFEIIAHRISSEQKAIIESSKLEGVFTYPEEFRYYPGETLASQLVGFVGSDGDHFVGRYGSELSFEKILAGTPGRVSGKRDAGGRRMLHEPGETISASDGSSIVLSVRHTAQYEAEKILKEAIEKNEATSGSITVMEPDTGKILAMASYPNFNPNEYAKVEDLSLFMNPPTQFLYECGSVFKPFTLAMGLDQGVITPESTYTDTGIVQAGRYTIQNSDKKANGVQTMTQVLEKSLNTGTVYVERLVGNKVFGEYVRRFGFGENTGSGLVGESSGNIKNLDFLGRDINFYTASFGQGISVTPLQLARAFSSLANGGRLMRPQIIDRILHEDGTEEVIAPVEDRRVLQEKTSRQIGEMLYSVVENGHGKQAKVPGYLVAGKTGTAQVVKQGEKGYAEGTNIGTFVGYAPLNNPKFVVVAKIDNPKNVAWAESSAAPAFQRMMSFLLTEAKIPPTEETKKK